MTLEYTVPFITHNESNESKLIIDKVEIRNDTVIKSELFNILTSKLDLDYLGDYVPSEIAVNLIENQYKVCLNVIYSNPIWEKIRKGEGREILLAYIIENTHYLYAAVSRMSSGLAFHSEIHPYSFILSEHLIEEADHAVFFENALVQLGCDKRLVSISKPSPITLEWIYLMRALSAKHPLVSAVCSGLMENSAKNHEAVKGWHEMLIESKVLKPEAIRKFYEHVELDIALGHGDCWEEAILSEEVISTELLVACLNSVTIISDQLYRWFGSLDSGLSGVYINLLKDIKYVKTNKPTLSNLDNHFNGDPVISSEVLKLVSYGRSELNKSVAEIVGLSYFLSPAIHSIGSIKKGNIVSSSEQFAKSTQSSVNTDSGIKLKSTILSWMKVVDGHELWNKMLNDASENLIFGYIFENYHYLRSSLSHTSAALFSCTNSLIREDLVKHLTEEAKHCEILSQTLESFSEKFVTYQLLRPLPTTILFTGFLRELAISDWKAYCIAISFLQLSIDNESAKHAQFYEEMGSKYPDLKILLHSIAQHDKLDADLGHVNDIEKLIDKLFKSGISYENLQRASMVCTLTWSFLDGINQYYSVNNSVNCRLGWNKKKLSWA